MNFGQLDKSELAKDLNLLKEDFKLLERRIDSKNKTIESLEISITSLRETIRSFNKIQKYPDGYVTIENELKFERNTPYYAHNLYYNHLNKCGDIIKTPLEPLKDINNISYIPEDCIVDAIIKTKEKSKKIEIKSKNDDEIIATFVFSGFDGSVARIQ